MTERSLPEKPIQKCIKEPEFISSMCPAKQTTGTLGCHAHNQRPRSNANCHHAPRKKNKQTNWNVTLRRAINKNCVFQCTTPHRIYSLRWRPMTSSKKSATFRIRLESVFRSTDWLCAGKSDDPSGIQSVHVYEQLYAQSSIQSSIPIHWT